MPSSERSRGGQAKMDSFDCLGLKTITGGWFPSFGCETMGGLHAVKVRRRTRGAIMKLASRRSEVVKAACLSDAPIKILMNLPLRRCVA